MSHETQDDEHNAAKLTARDLLDAFETGLRDDAESALRLAANDGNSKYRKGYWAGTARALLTRADALAMLLAMPEFGAHNDAFEKVHRAMVDARRHGTTEEHLAAAAEMVHTVRKLDASRAGTPSGLLGLFKHGKSDDLHGPAGR